MASETRGRPRRVQGCMSKPTGSILSRVPLPFGGSNKLAETQAPLPRPSNVPIVAPRPSNALAAVFVDFEALSRIYSNEEVQDIIQTVIKAKPTATKGP